MITNDHGTIGSPGKEIIEIHPLVSNGTIKIPGYVVKEHEYNFAPSCRVDFLLESESDNSFAYLEVKPWETRIDDLQQLMKYQAHNYERNKLRHFILCAYIKPERLELLNGIGVEVFLIRDLIPKPSGQITMSTMMHDDILFGNQKGV